MSDFEEKKLTLFNFPPFLCGNKRKYNLWTAVDKQRKEKMKSFARSAFKNELQLFKWVPEPCMLYPHSNKTIRKKEKWGESYD